MSRRGRPAPPRGNWLNGTDFGRFDLISVWLRTDPQADDPHLAADDAGGRGLFRAIRHIVDGDYRKAGVEHWRRWRRRR